jgi:hypothetical protein
VISQFRGAGPLGCGVRRREDPRVIDGRQTQLASDVIRDGLGVELLVSDSRVLAEVFRCDADHTVTVSAFERLPLGAVEWLLAVARERSGAFEDGTPLPPRSGR